MNALVVSVAMAATLAACSSDNGFVLGRQGELLRHETQWEHRDFHSYSYDFVQQKFGDIDSLHVIVVNDAISSVTGTSLTGFPINPSDVPTIDALFADADAALPHKELSVDLEFNDSVGYMTLYTVSGNNPGGGYSARVYNLTPQQ